MTSFLNHCPPFPSPAPPSPPSSRPSSPALPQSPSSSRPSLSPIPRQVQSSAMQTSDKAWVKYLSNYSEANIDTLSYGDRILLSLSPDWNERIKLNGINVFPNIPSLDSNHSKILTQYFEQMTSRMIEHAQVHKEIALLIQSKLKEIIESSLVNTSYKCLDFQLFGSTVNCLALESSSDLDFCLMVESIGPATLDLKILFDHLARNLMSKGYLVIESRLRARVPILCLKDPSSDLEIDICVNSPYGIRNTHLIGQYILQDSRLQPLLLLLKKWSKAKGVANTQNSTISSYSWTLLAIHFLLNFRFPNSAAPLLNLIENDEEVRSGDINVDQINLADIFLQFFIYYGVYAQEHLVNSVLLFQSPDMKLSKTISTSTQSPLWRLCLIDPLDPSHDLGSCITRCEGQVFMLNQLFEIVETFQYFLSSPEPIWDELIEKIFEINSSVSLLPKLCSSCGSEGHFSRNCPELICYTCGQSGHISTDCSNRICFKCKRRHVGKLCQEEVSDNLTSNQSNGTPCSGARLLQNVLHWNIETLLGPSLLGDTPEIPEVFESSSQWFSTFFPFILEDLRCNIGGLVQNFRYEDENQQFILQPVIHSLSRSLNPTFLGKMGFEVKNELDLKTIENDMCGLGIFIKNLSTMDLQEQLQKCDHFFVHVERLVSPPNSPLIYSCQFPNKTYLQEIKESNCQDWKFVYLGANLIGSRRVCDALGRQIRPCFMKDILRGNVHAVDNQRDQVPLGDSNLVIDASLNESQRDAISQVLFVGAPRHPRIQLIKGPPGTGKTRTIVCLIDTLICCKLRVHVAAPTNIAVIEIAKRFISKYPHRKPLIVGTLSRLQLTEELIPFHLECKSNKITSSISEINEAKSRLSALLRSDMDPSNDVFVEFRQILQLLESCLTLFRDAPLGLVKKVKLCSDIYSLFENVSKISEIEFMKWYNQRTSEDHAEGDTIDLIQQLTEFLGNIQFDQKFLQNLNLSLLLQAEVLFSTVNVGGREIFSLVPVDITIIDEASQLLPGDIATIFRPDLQGLVLVGDEKQLPATVHSQEAIKKGYGESLFARLINLNYPLTLLNIQYRMHPIISCWPSGNFYSSNLQDGLNVMSQEYNKSWHKVLRPVEFYDVRAGGEDQVGSSHFHEIQAMVVRRILAYVRNTTSAESIGIISPYKEQIALLSHLSKNTPDLSIKVCTIDGFQGQECDVIILTTVRSNKDRKIGFLSDLRRLNVAITRSRYSLIVVGDRHTISSNIMWRSYIDYIADVGVVRGADSSDIIKKVAKTATDSTKRFGELLTIEKDPFCNALWKVTFSKEFQKSLLSPI